VIFVQVGNGARFPPTDLDYNEIVDAIIDSLPLAVTFCTLDNVPGAMVVWENFKNASCCSVSDFII
jgi:hypothetical protein